MRQNYFLQLFKRFFWAFIDYILKIITISVLWFVFNIPFFIIFLIALYSGITNLYFYLALIIIILFSPISFGANYYTFQITSQYFDSEKFHLFNKVLSQSDIKISIFFKGIKKYFLKSIFLTIINLILLLFIYLSLKFYLQIVVNRIPLFGFFLAGIVLWIFVVYIFILNYQIPLIISKEINVLKAYYQSFLLMLDNLFYTLGVVIFLISMSLIFILTIAGFVLIFYGFISLFQQIAMLVIYQKYDESLKLREEYRTLKNILKPWD